MAKEKMNYEKDILPVIQTAVESAWKPIAKKYHLYEETESEIENKHGEGFVAFTDGGYMISAFNPLNEFDGTGINMPTEKSQKAVDKWIQECYNDAGKEHEEDTEEHRDAYAECTGGIPVTFEIRAIYYKPDNRQNEFKGKDAVYVFGIINEDSKENRDLIEEGFSFDGVDELKTKLDAATEKVLTWFKVSDKMGKGGKGGKAESGVTKTEIKGNGEDGYHFNVYYGGRDRAGFVSASYKTEEEAEEGLEKYLETGKYDLYGSAEMEEGGSIDSPSGNFWSYFGNDGALITGGSYISSMDCGGYMEEGGNAGVGKWVEIRNDYVEGETSDRYIDAWVTGADDEEGKSIAIVNKDGNVTYKDEDAKTDTYAQEMIQEAVAMAKKSEYGAGGKVYSQKRMPMSKRGRQIDGKVKAKHVGWRVAGDSDRTPTHAEQTAGKTKDGKSVFYEDRENRSDKSRSAKK